MGLAQGGLGGCRGGGAGEDEAEVGGSPSGSGTIGWLSGAVISSPVTPGTARASSTPSTPRSSPRRGIGIIITPAAAPVPRQRLERQADGVAQDQLLQRHARAELAGRSSTARRSSARRSRRARRPRSFDPQLGVDRPVRSPSAAAAAAVRVGDGGLDRRPAGARA